MQKGDIQRFSEKEQAALRYVEKLTKSPHDANDADFTTLKKYFTDPEIVDIHMLAALVNLFNETRTDHILTMEDPVEFVHPFKNCLINQREVGSHTVSFASGLAPRSAKVVLSARRSPDA